MQKIPNRCRSFPIGLESPTRGFSYVQSHNYRHVSSTYWWNEKAALWMWWLNHSTFQQHTYLRVHVHPKRFPMCYSFDWRKSVIVNEDDYVVIDKPYNVPVGGTVDNLLECCAYFGGQAVGLDRPLQLTHQLDLCTQGCVVMAKNRQFASQFNQLLQGRKVRKLYKALTASAPAPGRHIHFMLPDPYSPKILTREAMPGWQPCELVIRRVEEVAWPADSALAAADVDCSYWPAADVAYECLVELITGRTHQLRAQFAALGTPLIGDTMYGPAQAQQAAPMVLKATISHGRGSADARGSGVGDHSYDGRERRKALVDAEVLSQAKHLFGPAPEAAIGLQAFSVRWEEQVEENKGRVRTVYKEYEAGKPWWGEG
ncbi:unnamed protein product [Closterium sp. Yama58-4]|nr:unnamed protein product [Closterium sp. Yama58-4]